MRILLSVSGLVLAFLLNTASAQPAWTEASDSNLVPGKPIKASQIKEIRDAIGWNVSGGNAYRASGNVGIGTTSPTDNLTIYGQNPKLHLKGNSVSYYPSLKLSGLDGTYIGGLLGYAFYGMYYESSNLHVFRTGGQEKMRINSSGNVGIGTTSPTQKLSVAGNIDLNDGELYLRDAAGGTFGMGYATEGGSQMTLFGDHLIQFTESDADAVRVHMDMNNGNVGIGTTSPSQKLHVVGDTYLQGALYLGSTDTALFRDTANRIATDDNFYVRAGSPNTYLYSTNTYLGASSGDTTRLRGNNFVWNQGIIQGNGNVGIGTTSPTSGLHIARGTDISSANDTSAGLLIGTGGAQLAIDGNEMQAHNGTSAIGYALQPFGGSVGIGRFPNSAHKLDVAGNIRATGNNIINNTAPTVYLQDTDHRSGMIHMNSSRMYFLRGSGNNSLSWAHTGGHWPLYLNMENNDAHFGGDVYIKGEKVEAGGGSSSGGASTGIQIRSMFTEESYTNHFCGITTDDDLYCWGYNGHFTTGTGVSGTPYSPMKLNIENVDKVYSSYYHTCALKKDGDLHCWGYNGHGQIGNGSTANQAYPTVTPVLEDVVDVSLMYYGTCALKSNGTVWCWGYNGYGQIGDGTNTQRYTPVQVAGLTGAVEIDGVQSNYRGYHDFMCARKSNGTVWCWGYNGYGTLGDGTSTSRSTPVQFGNHSDYTKMVALGDHAGQVCGLRTNKEVWCAGYNGYGHLGQGNTTTQYSPVKIGGMTNVKEIIGSNTTYASHMCLLKEDGTVWCAGNDAYGNLGDGTAGGSATNYQQVPGLSNIESVKISSHAYNAQSAFTCAKDSNKNLYCWGYGGHCNLGLDSTCSSSNPTPKKVVGLDGKVEDFFLPGANYYGGCAVLTNGDLNCWGYDAYRRSGTGNDGVGDYIYSPLKVNF